MLRKILAAACFVLFAIVPASADSWTLISEQHNVTISSSTGSVCGNGANYAAVQVTGANAYYTFNTSTPSSTNGFVLSQNNILTINGSIFVSNFKIIQSGSGAAMQVVCANQSNQ